MRRFATLLMAALLSALIASACGGGNEGSGGTNASPASEGKPAEGGAEPGLADGGGDLEGGADGGSGAPEATTAADPKPLSKAVFIKQGDQICRRGSAKIVKELQSHKTEYGRGFGAQPTKKQNEEGVVDLILPVIEEEARELSELGAPRGEEAKVEAIVEALEGGVEDTKADPGAALSGGPNPLAEASKLSKAFGFKFCGT